MNSLFNQLLNLHDNFLMEVGNNYVQNTIVVNVFVEGIQMETFCRNEYGSYWGNEDLSFVPLEELPDEIFEIFYNRMDGKDHFEVFDED